MGTKTGIEWTDSTWNPIIGCSRVSEGCRNCYAEGVAARFGAGKETVYSGLTQIVNGHPQWTGVIKETRQLLQPLSWKNPRRIFVNSMSDLFHENLSDEQIDKIFAVMVLCPRHKFQVLTKRPKRMRDYFAAEDRWFRIQLESGRLVMGTRWVVDRTAHRHGDFLDHVWLGVSCENQAAADERIPLLLETPAAIKFISAEPLLGSIDFRKVPSFNRIGLSLSNWWVIAGGESGPHARPMHPDWARQLRDQCERAGVPFFFKQWGEWSPDAKGEFLTAKVGEEPNEHVVMRVGKKQAGSLLDGREWKNFPS